MSAKIGQPAPGEFLLYETEGGRVRVECRFAEDTLWLSQGLMAELFQTSKQNIAKHLKAIFAEGELSRDSVVNQWLTTAEDGKAYRVDYYSLDAVLAVGYRVRSPRGVQFRRWATERLAEYLVKGFTMDDDRLKNPPVAGKGAPDRFDELLARIRDIRASERRMYLRVREIFTMASDYAPSHKDTTQFFRFIQNKLHFAADQALRRKEIFLRNWVDKLDEFLRFNERRVLGHAGTVSHADALAHAEQAYEQFAVRRRAWLEADGAVANVRALEEAKVLAPPNANKGKKV